MNKEKLLILIPLLAIVALLSYTWVTFIFTEKAPVWKHYLALLFFSILIVLFLRSTRQTVIGTGIFLILATVDLAALLPSITTAWVRIGPISTPPLQPLTLGLLILYFLLNANTLFDTYLDFQEVKKSRSRGKS